MLNFTVETNDCPDDTCFTAKDVLPWIDTDGVFQVVDGRGTRRSWGAPSVSSTVTQLTDDVVQIEVVGWHKHTISPVGGCYYFVLLTSGWERKMGSAKVVKAAKAQYEALKAA